MKRWWWLASLLLVRVGFAGEQYLKLEYEPDLLESEQIEIRTNSVPASPYPGGYGFVVIELKNPDQKPHTVALELQSTNRGVHFSVAKHVALDNGGKGRVTLPMPTGAAGSLLLEATADGYESGKLRAGFNESEQRAQPTLLVVRDSSKAAEPFVDMVRAWRGTTSGSRSSSTVDEFDAISAIDLPDEWPMLSGFGVIVVDMSASDLDDGKQQRLVDYASAGGALLVFDHRVGDSPLGRLRTQEYEDGQTVASGAIGFGAYATVANGSAPSSEWEREIHSQFERTFDLHGPMNAGLAPATMRAGVPIPGLGRVKVKLFLLLILGFVIVIGMVAWRASRRRGASIQLVWKIPAVGLGFAAAIVVFGLLSEGIAVRGAIISVALLDQEAHRVVAISTRSVYAGLGTGPLKLSQQSVLSSSQLQFDVFGDRNHSLEIDLDAERSIGQSLLPSRTPTSLEIVSVAAARERLRFERSGQGYKLLASDEFAPDSREQSILFCDFDGEFFVGSNRGDLVPVSQADANKIVFEQADRVSSPPGMIVPRELRLTNELPRGSYQAVVSNAPYLEDLGIEIDYGTAKSHLVRGFVSSEDVK